MTKRSLLLLGVLAMVTLPIASAKSYDIAFSGPTMVGNTQLPAGEYTLKVEGSNAVITNGGTITRASPRQSRSRASIRSMTGQRLRPSKEATPGTFP